MHLYTFYYPFKLWNVLSFTSYTFKQLKTVLIILAHFSKEHSYQEAKMTRFIYTAAEYTSTQTAGKFFIPMAKVATRFDSATAVINRRNSGEITARISAALLPLLARLISRSNLSVRNKRPVEGLALARALSRFIRAAGDPSELYLSISLLSGANFKRNN